MSIRLARPLPECRACQTPTRRAVFLRNGGICSTCLESLGDTVRMTRLPLAPDELEQPDATVYVERHLPPVPGQLRIDEEQS